MLYTKFKSFHLVASGHELGISIMKEYDKKKFITSYACERKLSNDMWHATYMQVNRGDSQLLVVGSQINNLTPDPSFGHNLCFKYPNGSCKPI
jgi:hypothetical protein